MRNYYATNRERYRNYYAANREHILEAQCILRAENRETLIKQQLTHSACDGRRGCGEDGDGPMALEIIEIRDE